MLDHNHPPDTTTHVVHSDPKREHHRRAATLAQFRAAIKLARWPGSCTYTTPDPDTPPEPVCVAAQFLVLRGVTTETLRGCEGVNVSGLMLHRPKLGADLDGLSPLDIDTLATLQGMWDHADPHGDEDMVRNRMLVFLNDRYGVTERTP